MEEITILCSIPVPNSGPMYKLLWQRTDSWAVVCLQKSCTERCVNLQETPLTGVVNPSLHLYIRSWIQFCSEHAVRVLDNTQVLITYWPCFSLHWRQLLHLQTLLTVKTLRDASIRQNLSSLHYTFKTTLLASQCDVFSLHTLSVMWSYTKGPVSLPASWKDFISKIITYWSTNLHTQISQSVA